MFYDYIPLFLQWWYGSGFLTLNERKLLFWPFSLLHFESFYCFFQKWRLCLVYLILIDLLWTCHCALDKSVCFFCLHRGFPEYESAFFADMQGGLFASSERHICPERWVSLLLSCSAPLNVCAPKYSVLPLGWYLALLSFAITWKACFVEFYTDTPFSELRENHLYHPTAMPWLTGHTLSVLSLFALALSALLPLGIGLHLDSSLFDVCLFGFACEPNDALSSGTYWSALRILLDDMLFVTFLPLKTVCSSFCNILMHVLFHAFQTFFCSTCSIPPKICSLPQWKEKKCLKLDFRITLLHI